MTDDLDEGLPTDLDAITRGTLMERMGIRLVTASPERVVATMPVKGNTQPYGLLHGGASCVLAETLASVGAAAHGATLGMVALGLEINATHHRSARQGQVTGEATALSLGRSVASYQVVVRDDDERLVCTARITCLLRPSPA